MEFSPHNPVVKLCIQGMALEGAGQLHEATALFHHAWNEATDDVGKFLAAHFIARTQSGASEKLHWLNTALQLALSIPDPAVQSALPTVHRNLANAFEEMGDTENASMHYTRAESIGVEPNDPGPFYHGTKADLQPGDLLTAGFGSNYQDDLMMNHIYFTALPNGAGLAASLAKGGGPERVYMVEPTGSFEHDPNVTDKKFPGNLTRSYRSSAPLKIIGEVPDWVRQSPDELKKWQERLANNKGEIIN
jgi:rifampin ADP-ribosylating transferase